MKHHRQTVALVLILVITCVSVAHSATLTVRRDGSGDFTTIQPALDAATPGDTIDIGPGEYTEFQAIRPPLWSWDIEIYAYITVDNLTIVGAGVDQTLIGPLTPQYDLDHFSPICMHAGTVEDLLVRNLTVRNCYRGIYGPSESLALSDCRVEQTKVGIDVRSDSFQAERCTLTGVGSTPTGIQHDADCSYSYIRDCAFIGSSLHYSGVENFVARNCTFDGGNGGIGVGASDGLIDGCEIACFVYGISVSYGSMCEIRQTRITGGTAGLSVEGGSTSVTATAMVIASTIQGAVRLSGPGAFSIHDSDLLPASGYAAEMYEHNTPPAGPTTSLETSGA